MLRNLVYSKQPFARVLMDSWYAAQKLMALIEQLGKIYYCPLKRNRLVDDSGGVEKYKQIEQLSWSREEQSKGSWLKLKTFLVIKGEIIPGYCLYRQNGLYSH